MSIPAFVQSKIDGFKPQYNDLKFDSPNDFLIWVNKTTKTVIFFKDDGQDLVKLHVASNGEIIHTEIASLGSIYNGSLLLDEPELLLPGDIISLWVTMFSEVSTFKYTVEKVISR